MRIEDLREKEVINECNCRRLGYVSDVEINIMNFSITHIIVPGEGKCLGLFGYDSEYVIPCKCIRQIGQDLIMVSVNEEEVLEKTKR